MSQGKLAKLVGTTPQQIGHLESGKRKLSQEWMFRLAPALRCQPSDLFPTPRGPKDVPVLSTSRVKVLGDVQAGVFKAALEWPPEDQFEMTVVLQAPYNRLPAFGLKVIGPSMDMEFPEGSYVVCVRLHDLGEDFELESGRFVIVLARNSTDELEATIKQFKVDAQGKAWLWPRSTHPDFQQPIKVRSLANNQDDEFDGNEDVKIWALVVADTRMRA